MMYNRDTRVRLLKRSGVKEVNTLLLLLEYPNNVYNLLYGFNVIDRVLFSPFTTDDKHNNDNNNNINNSYGENNW